MVPHPLNEGYHRFLLCLKSSVPPPHFHLISSFASFQADSQGGASDDPTMLVRS